MSRPSTPPRRNTKPGSKWSAKEKAYVIHRGQTLSKEQIHAKIPWRSEDAIVAVIQRASADNNKADQLYEQLEIDAPVIAARKRKPTDKSKKHSK
jgi:hypothetical protein